LDGDSDDSPFTLVATFCTAEIPLEVINEYVTASFAESHHHGMTPCVLNVPNQSFRDYYQATRAPVHPFHSQFLGASMEDCVVLYNDMFPEASDEEIPHVPGENSHANCVFVILDEQTIIDHTVCGVSLLNGVETLRADFRMALEILDEHDLGVFSDGPFQDFYDRGETVTFDAYVALKEQRRKETAERDERVRKEREAKREREREHGILS